MVEAVGSSPVTQTSLNIVDTPFVRNCKRRYFYKNYDYDTYYDSCTKKRLELITWQYTITGYAKAVALHFLADLEHGTALNAEDYDKMSCREGAGVILRHADLAVLMSAKTAAQHISLQAESRNTVKNAVRKW